jgi:hypothetical protein
MPFMPPATESPRRKLKPQSGRAICHTKAASVARPITSRGRLGKHSSACPINRGDDNRDLIMPRRRLAADLGNRRHWWRQSVTRTFAETGSFSSTMGEPRRFAPRMPAALRSSGSQTSRFGISVRRCRPETLPRCHDQGFHDPQSRTTVGTLTHFLNVQKASAYPNSHQEESKASNNTERCPSEH